MHEDRTESIPAIAMLLMHVKGNAECDCVFPDIRPPSPLSFPDCLPELAHDSPAVLTASGLNEVSGVATVPNGHIKRRH